MEKINPVTASFLEQWLACLTGFEGELLRKKDFTISVALLKEIENIIPFNIDGFIPKQGLKLNHVYNEIKSSK